jgi:hypothetical protein
MPRPTIALLCLILPLAAAAAGPEGREIPYQNLYEPLAAVKKADPEGIVKTILLAESVQADQPLPADLKIEVRHGAQATAISVASDGRFDLPLEAGWASAGATVRINHPKSEVKVVEQFTMRTPATLRLTYGALMESLPVMERIQAQHVDIHGLLATRPDGVELAFVASGPQSVTIGTGALAHAWKSDDQGLVKVPFDPKLPKDTPVVLSAPPDALLPYAN